MALKILGALLIAFGGLDLVMANFMQVDIWMEWFGIDLFAISELLWQYISWAFMLVGFGLWSLGGRGEEEPEEE